MSMGSVNSVVKISCVWHFSKNWEFYVDIESGMMTSLFWVHWNERGQGKSALPKYQTTLLLAPPEPCLDENIQVGP